MLFRCSKKLQGNANGSGWETWCLILPPVSRAYCGLLSFNFGCQLELCAGHVGLLCELQTYLTELRHAVPPTANEYAGEVGDGAPQAFD